MSPTVPVLLGLENLDQYLHRIEVNIRFWVSLVKVSMFKTQYVFVLSGLGLDQDNRNRWLFLEE